MKSIVIAGYTRTPFHFAHKGDLTRVRPDDLAAHAVTVSYTHLTLPTILLV